MHCLANSYPGTIALFESPLIPRISKLKRYVPLFPVTPFAYSMTFTLTDVLEVTSPPLDIVTVEAVSGTSISGNLPSQVTVTETTTAGHADTAGISTAEDLGSFAPYHAVHDGANEPVLDSNQGLVWRWAARMRTRWSSSVRKSTRGRTRPGRRW